MNPNLFFETANNKTLPGHPGLIVWSLARKKTFPFNACWLAIG